MGQAEDTWQPYLDVTKEIYKLLLKVVKNSNTGTLSITSKVFQITAVEGEWSPFPRPYNMHNFGYVIVDPSKRTLQYWARPDDRYWAIGATSTTVNFAIADSGDID